MAQSNLANDRGSISLFAIVVALAAMLLVGLVVDGGAKIRATQRADAVAREAARQGGQALQAGLAIRGQGVRGDPSAGRAAAQNYLSSAGVSGSVRIANTRIVVDTQATYQTVFLDIIGIGSGSVTGHGEARIVRAFEGAER